MMLVTLGLEAFSRRGMNFIAMKYGPAQWMAVIWAKSELSSAIHHTEVDHGMADSLLDRQELVHQGRLVAHGGLVAPVRRVTSVVDEVIELV